MEYVSRTGCAQTHKLLMCAEWCCRPFDCRICKTISSTLWSINECASLVLITRILSQLHNVQSMPSPPKSVRNEFSVIVTCYVTTHFIWLMETIMPNYCCESQTATSPEYSLRIALSRITHRDDECMEIWTALWSPKLFSEWHKSTTHSPGI